VFQKEEDYLNMEIAFNWFLGSNRLHQIIYNPCTTGCYDGLEETHVNLNQGAESILSYLMARLTVEKYTTSKRTPGEQKNAIMPRRKKSESGMILSTFTLSPAGASYYFITNALGVTTKESKDKNIYD